MKLSGVVTEDKVTGDRYITHVTLMKDMMDGRRPEPDQMDSEGPVQGEDITVQH